MPRSRRADREDELLPCPHCQGAGGAADPDNPMQFNDCPLCRGDGRVSHARHDAYLRQRAQAEEQRRMRDTMSQRQQPPVAR